MCGAALAIASKRIGIEPRRPSGDGVVLHMPISCNELFQRDVSQPKLRAWMEISRHRLPGLVHFEFRKPQTKAGLRPTEPPAVPAHKQQ